MTLNQYDDEPLLQRLFKEFNVTPTDYINVDNDIITSGSSNTTTPSTSHSFSNTETPEPEVMNESSGEDDCGTEYPKISSQAVMKSLETINAFCVQTGADGDLLISLDVFTSKIENHIMKVKSQAFMTDFFTF